MKINIKVEGNEEKGFKAAKVWGGLKEEYVDWHYRTLYTEIQDLCDKWLYEAYCTNENE